MSMPAQINILQLIPFQETETALQQQHQVQAEQMELV
jgi:hypothetical protein